MPLHPGAESAQGDLDADLILFANCLKLYLGLNTLRFPSAYLTLGRVLCTTP